MDLLCSAMMKLNILQSLKPRTSRRHLLFIASLVWAVAGGMLLLRGILLAGNTSVSLLLKITSLAGGILFYLLLFSALSLKHVNRIINLKKDNPCIFSFFSLKSYILMSLMITSGILLRKSGIFMPEYQALLYITMGIPLLISSFRFCYHGINYRY